MPPPGWTAAQHDFQQRLNRLGITVSESKRDAPSDTLNDPVVRTRGGAYIMLDRFARGTKAGEAATKSVRNEDFPSTEHPAMTSLINNERQSKVDALERQLRQARSEVQMWKEKCEAQERDLRMSYGETMKWRMEYEDLYTAIIRDQEIQPPKGVVKRHGTKSLG